MITKTTLTLAAALLVPSLNAQQNPQPQPQAPQLQQVPCPPPPPKPPRGIHFHVPKAIQDRLNKQLAGISKTTGVDLQAPTPADLAKQVQKPCIAPAVTTPPPTQKQ